MEFFKEALVPGLSALLAIIGLFLDKEKPYFKILSAVVIIMVLVLGYMQILQSKEAKRESVEANSKIETLIKLADNTVISVVKSSTYLTDILLSQPQILADFGLTRERAGKDLESITTKELVKGEILEANQALGKLVAQRLPSKRQGFAIWYYNKEMDNPKLVGALKEIGFEIANKMAKDNQKNDPTNAVWHGPEVDLLDYKIVILSLIRAGVDVRRAGPSCKNLSAKKKTIEVGASDQAAGLFNGIKSPTISVSTILAAKSFEEIDNATCN
jgi:hypothetical protein